MVNGVNILKETVNGQVATDNGAPEGTYTTVVQFVVDKEGNISDVRASDQSWLWYGRRSYAGYQKRTQMDSCCTKWPPGKSLS